MESLPRRASCPRCRALFRRQLARCPIDGARLEPIPGDPLVGSVLGGRYLLEGVAGDTASSRIYLAVDRDTEAQVSVRMLFGEYASVPRHRAGFAREVRIARLFEHPNVLGVIDAGESEGGLPFLVTERVDGRSLAALVREEGPFTPSRVVRVARKVCAALVHIHGAGVIHRNLSGASVLLETHPGGEVVRVTSFHHAVRLGDPADDALLASEAKIVGRPPYLAPEQVLRRPIDQRVDLFSLGVLIYHMACGALPFDGAPLELAIQTGFEAPPPMARRVPEFTGDAAVEALAMRLMSKDPEDRHPDAAALWAALADL